MISVRVNTLLASKAEVIPEFEQAFSDVRAQTLEWYGDALLLHGVSVKELQSLPLYTEGKIYIQNPSSMLPPLILEPQANEKVLDMCAAPGSKTTQLAARMKNTGELIANDVSRARMFKLKAILERYGVTNTTLKNQKGEFLWRTYENYFDRVLVDAPCSMDQDLPMKKIKLLAKQQQFLLRSAYACTKPGGTFVYSTCTSRVEENEDVVAWLLKKESGAHLDPIDFEPLAHFVRNEGYMRIVVDGVFESFFVARFKKVQA